MSLVALPKSLVFSRNMLPPFFASETLEITEDEFLELIFLFYERERHFVAQFSHIFCYSDASHTKEKPNRRGFIH